MIGYSVFYRDGLWFYELLTSVGFAAVVSAVGYTTKCDARQAALSFLSLLKN